MGALRPVVFHACNSATLDLESKSQLEVWSGFALVLCLSFLKPF